MDIRGLSSRDLKVLRDWRQYSWDVHGEDWVTPDEDLIPDFISFIKHRDHVWTVDEVVDYMGEGEMRLYIQELRLLKNILRDCTCQK